MLHEFFTDDIRIDNHAVNGRSSLSFINEGRWDRVICQVEPGDFVIIQFGHNDEKDKPDRHTDPGTTFDANLERFVNETRDKGGIPILMNSVVRRNFPDESPDVLVDTHGLYKEAPKNVAQRLHVHFIDANRITHELEQKMGPEDSKKLHMWFDPGQHPSEPEITPKPCSQVTSRRSFDHEMCNHRHSASLIMLRARSGFQHTASSIMQRAPTGSQQTASSTTQQARASSKH